MKPTLPIAAMPSKGSIKKLWSDEPPEQRARRLALEETLKDPESAETALPVPEHQE